MSFSFSMDFDVTGIDSKQIDHFLNAPSGEVGRYLAKRGTLILMAARRDVGVDTGQLKADLYMIHRRNAAGQYVQIGADNRIALLHHNGTRPHYITPNNQQFLRYSSGGRMVYSRSVLHPGTRPNHYLSDNLSLVRV